MAEVHFVVNGPKTRNFEIWPQVQVQVQEDTQKYTSRDSDKTSYAGT